MILFNASQELTVEAIVQLCEALSSLFEVFLLVFSLIFNVKNKFGPFFIVKSNPSAINTVCSHDQLIRRIHLSLQHASVELRQLGLTSVGFLICGFESSFFFIHILYFIIHIL